MTRARALPLACTLMLLLAPAALVPRAAHAQSANSAANRGSPVVQSLRLTSDAGLEPGAQLNFELRGTPRGRASVRVNNSALVVNLRETQAGVYQGSHVVRRTDRIDPLGQLRASVGANNHTATRYFTFPPEFQNLAAQKGGAPAAANSYARIERFNVDVDGPLEPGAVMRLELQGTPRALAQASLPGVDSPLALREVQPGLYRGQYTVRRGDDLNALSNVRATLQAQGQTATAGLNRPLGSTAANAAMPGARVLGAAPGNLPLRITSHASNAVVEGQGAVQVSGQTAPGAAVRVRVDAIPPVAGERLGVARTLMSQIIQADAQGNFSFSFEPREWAMPGTRYEVSVGAGNGNQTAETRLSLMQRS